MKSGPHADGGLVGPWLTCVFWPYRVLQGFVGVLVVRVGDFVIARGISKSRYNCFELQIPCLSSYLPCRPIRCYGS